jgi:uncharacterized membrane protein YidH (DUF202 family)
MSAPSYDPGLGNERTALAWQRTALSVVAGAAVVSRLTLDRVGVAAVLATGAAGLIGIWLFLESRERYRHDAGLRLRSRGRGGRSPLALAIAVAVLALTELAALLLR